jgi:monofunctional biosynthetic peptidoglycan transglycosylase
MAEDAHADIDETGGRRSCPRRLARGAVAALSALCASAALLALYALVIYLRVPSVRGLGQSGDPGPTAFMRASGCAPAVREYRPLADIDPSLACTVVWAEDLRFFRHQGVDTRALEGALRDNLARGEPRLGGSTIAMQLAKNLYFSAERTPSRKLRELIVAPRLHAAYGRERVLELYLNAAEWAPCVYGVEAASHYYFGHDARVLDPAEAAFLASMLPRPKRRPGATAADRTHLIRRQQALITSMGRAGLLSSAAMRSARAEVFVLLPANAGETRRAHGAVSSRPASSEWLAKGCGTDSENPLGTH